MIITDNLTFDLIAILVSIQVGIIAYLKWKLTYWEKVGLPTLNPTLPFGGTKDLLLKRKTFSEQFQEIYRQLRAKNLKHAGIYFGPQATYMPTDPELIKHILQIDFQHFVNHGGYMDEKNDPLSGHLFNLEDAKWKDMRLKLTPTFTSRKMKMMFPTLVACTSHLKKTINDSAINHKAIDIKEMLCRFTMTDDEEIIDEYGKTQEKGLTMNQLAAQAFVFFLAGFESAGTTMTFALYELAVNPVQEKLKDEINIILSKHNGELSYDGLLEMTYMDKVLNEFLRKHPPGGIIYRQCTKDYITPNITIQLKKGTQVIIPVLGIHTDPQYNPNPEKFDPERFSEENKHSRSAFTWLPFGEGPRVCIGSRFGLLQSKLGLTTFLKDYEITSNKKKLPLKMDKNAFLPTAEGGIWLNVKKLE